jgi:hypothetical protein
MKTNKSRTKCPGKIRTFMPKIRTFSPNRHDFAEKSPLARSICQFNSLFHPATDAYANIRWASEAGKILGGVAACHGDDRGPPLQRTAPPDIEGAPPRSFEVLY